MTKAVLKQLIHEVISEVTNKKKKQARVAESYITSSSEDDVSLFVNIRIDVDSMDEGEKLRKQILKDLKTHYDVKVQEAK
jgi:hypothetical protein